MKKNYFLAACAAAFLTCGVFSACSEDDPIPDNGNENNGGGTTPTEEAFSRFVVATSTTASGNTTNTLLTSKSLTEGNITSLGEGLTIVAYSSDGIVEAVEVKDYPYGMGIQWHPEGMLPYDDAMLPLFQELVRASISKAAD